MRLRHSAALVAAALSCCTSPRQVPPPAPQPPEWTVEWVTSLPRDASVAEPFDLAFDEQGNAFAVFVVDPFDPKVPRKLMLARREGPGRWSTEEILSFTGEESPRLRSDGAIDLIATDGRVIAAWGSGDDRVYVVERLASGGFDRKELQKDYAAAPQLVNVQGKIYLLSRQTLYVASPSGWKPVLHEMNTSALGKLVKGAPPRAAGDGIMLTLRSNQSGKYFISEWHPGRQGWSPPRELIPAPEPRPRFAVWSFASDPESGLVCEALGSYLHDSDPATIRCNSQKEVRPFGYEGASPVLWIDAAGAFAAVGHGSASDDLRIAAAGNDWRQQPILPGASKPVPARRGNETWLLSSVFENGRSELAVARPRTQDEPPWAPPAPAPRAPAACPKDAGRADVEIYPTPLEGVFVKAIGERFGLGWDHRGDIQITWRGDLNADGIEDVKVLLGGCGSYGDCMVGVYAGCGGNTFTTVYGPTESQGVSVGKRRVRGWLVLEEGHRTGTAGLDDRVIGKELEFRNGGYGRPP